MSRTNACLTRQPAIDIQKLSDCNQKAKENNAQSPSGSAAMGVLLPISITFVKLACRLAECAYSARRRRDDLYYIGTFCGHLLILRDFRRVFMFENLLIYGIIHVQKFVKREFLSVKCDYRFLSTEKFFLNV